MENSGGIDLVTSYCPSGKTGQAARPSLSIKKRAGEKCLLNRSMRWTRRGRLWAQRLFGRKYAKHAIFLGFIFVLLLLFRLSESSEVQTMILELLTGTVPVLYCTYSAFGAKTDLKVATVPVQYGPLS